MGLRKLLLTIFRRGALINNSILRNTTLAHRETLKINKLEATSSERSAIPIEVCSRTDSLCGDGDLPSLLSVSQARRGKHDLVPVR